jgi:hypothetical protein
MPSIDTVEIWNPAGVGSEGGVDAVLRFPTRSAGGSLRIAYLDNVKPNTAELLELADQRLSRTFAVTSKTYRKEYGAGPARPGTYEEIAQTADLAVVGTAD